jgi:hypothetical protein
LKNQYSNFNSNETKILEEISQIHKKQYLSKKMRNEGMDPIKVREKVKNGENVFKTKNFIP